MSIFRVENQQWNLAIWRVFEIVMFSKTKRTVPNNKAGLCLYWLLNWFFLCFRSISWYCQLTNTDANRSYISFKKRSRSLAAGNVFLFTSNDVKLSLTFWTEIGRHKLPFLWQNSYCTGFNKDFSSLVNISSSGKQFSEQY